MKYNLISVGSITNAMKGREILLNNGLKAYIEKMPRNLSSTGCGYALYIPKDYDKAINLLTENGIMIKQLREREMPP